MPPQRPLPRTTARPDAHAVTMPPRRRSYAQAAPRRTKAQRFRRRQTGPTTKDDRKRLSSQIEKHRFALALKPDVEPIATLSGFPRKQRIDARTLFDTRQQRIGAVVLVF